MTDYSGYYVLLSQPDLYTEIRLTLLGTGDYLIVWLSPDGKAARNVLDARTIKRWCTDGKTWGSTYPEEMRYPGGI